MLYLLVKEDGTIKYPYTLKKLRLDNPNKSFPKKLSNERLATYGVFPVQEITPSPVGDEETIVRATIPTKVGTSYVLQHTLRPKTQEELDRDTVVRQTEFRKLRDSLLAETDYIMLTDYYSTLTNEQAVEVTQYRQALRDATSEWVLPTKPEWV